MRPGAAFVGAMTIVALVCAAIALATAVTVAALLVSDRPRMTRS